MFPNADEARISTPAGKMFLVLGYKRHTKDDPGQWVDQDGNALDWEHLHEETVASGETEEELVSSAKHHKRLQGMKWSDFFREILGAKKEVVDALKAHDL
jgi:hypothetical protein